MTSFPTDYTLIQRRRTDSRTRSGVGHLSPATPRPLPRPGAAAGADDTVRISDVFNYVSKHVPQHKSQH